MQNKQQSVKCDYFTATAVACGDSLFDLARSIFPMVNGVSQDYAQNKYGKTMVLQVGQQRIGMICTDAKDHDRNMLSLTGVGMSRISDLTDFAKGVQSLEQPRITRIDLALDFYTGQVSYEDCEAGLEQGDFIFPKTRTSPQVKRYEVAQDKRNYGRSLYVGKSPKQHRGYEKGLQIWGKLPDDIKKRFQPSAIFLEAEWGCDDRTLPDLWFRSEVQYNNADRVLPPEMLVERDEFYAGAYPWCAKIIGKTDGIRPKMIPPPEAATLLSQLNACKASYGPFIRALRVIRPDLPSDVILDLLCADKVSSSLLRAGALGPEHAQSLDALLPRQYRSGYQGDRLIDSARVHAEFP